MSKTSKIILVTIIATCILLGLGYAAITNITLNIAGTASATVDSGNFKVRFTDNIVVSDSAYVTATRTGDTVATINVSGLTTAGDKVTATYEIANDSTDLSSDLNVKATNSNANYFSVSSRLADTSLTAGSTTTVLVTIELLKTPIDADVSTNIGVTLNAIPVQPGEEGSSGLTNDFSKVPIDADLNEYGFFYGKAYSAYVVDTDISGIMSIIPYEDGHVEIYLDNYIMAYIVKDIVTYSENTISVQMESDGPPTVISVIENGYKLNTSGLDYDLNDTFTDNQNAVYDGELNEYGFYYDVPYVTMAVDSVPAAFIFHKDATVSIYYDGVFSETAHAAYSENKINNIFGSQDGFVFSNGHLISNGFMGAKLCPDYEIKNQVYIRKNEETGEIEYLTEYPDTVVKGNMFAGGDYLYTSTSNGWDVKLITDSTLLPDGYVYLGKYEESYPKVLRYLEGGGSVLNMVETYKDCINLKIAPEIPYSVQNMTGTFEGCTSLTTVPYEIPYNVTNMTNTFKGCTSLEGEIQINSNNITEYAGCFEGVDMSKITLTGSASDEIKDLLGKTGNNYTPLIPE